MDNNDEFDEWKIKKLYYGDRDKGLVRINKHDRKDKSGVKKFFKKDLVVIELEGSDSKIIRKIMGNDKKDKNDKRELGVKTILMDFDSRENNGKWKLKEGETYNLRIKKVQRCDFIKILSYYFCHPDIAVRLSSIALCLALIGLIPIIITIGQKIVFLLLVLIEEITVKLGVIFNSWIS